MKEGNISYIEDSPDVYVEVFAKSENTDVIVLLKDSHNHIDTVKVNGKVIYKNVLEKRKNLMIF